MGAGVGALDGRGVGTGVGTIVGDGVGDTLHSQDDRTFGSGCHWRWQLQRPGPQPSLMARGSLAYLGGRGKSDDCIRAA